MRELQLTRGYVALVDDEDYDRIIARGSWQSRIGKGTVYATRWMTVQGRNVAEQLHSFITGWPLVDHINSNGLDNRRENLRPATYGQNRANARLLKPTTSGYKGVTWHAKSRKWHARIRCQGKMHSLGLFDDPAQAARAYDAAARRLFGEYARTNFPEVAT